MASELGDKVVYEEDNRVRNIGLAIAAAVLVTACVVLFFVCGRTPDPVNAPTAYGAYAASDNSFTCEAPTGWHTRGMASGAIMSDVLFEKATARISIKSDMQGSLVADTMRASSNAAQDLLDNLPPGAPRPAIPTPRPVIESLHEWSGGNLAKKMPDFVEMPMQAFTSRIGDARVSEWTGTDDFAVHGYRATMLSGERRVTVFCQCRASDWKALKPAFERVIGSVAVGSGG